MNNSEKIILHLCASKYGSDTRDYREAGYDVRLITKEVGVENYHPPKNVYGIIANPPCTMFSIARTTKNPPRDLRDGMRLVKECLRIIWEAQYDGFTGNYVGIKSSLRFWALENPGTGLLQYFLGKPAFVYQPWEFGEVATKKTALWGRCNDPLRLILTNAKPNNHGVHRGEGSDKRSIASPKFTKAFFLSNP